VLSSAGCRATEAASREVVSLPMYPELTDAEVEQVCAALRSCFGC
jgi:dTDP-4-amino-4,6-dideoxygalactose transaminase